MKKLWSTYALLMMLFIPFTVFAQDAGSVSLLDWVAQIIATAKDYMTGGAPWQVKAALIITVLVSSMKVSVLNQWFWSKLGNYKIWLAPILGLAAGILNVLNGGSLGDVWQYLMAGAGAVFVHELLDLIKLIPGIGGMWLSLINAIESMPMVGTKSAGK